MQNISKLQFIIAEKNATKTNVLWTDGTTDRRMDRHRKNSIPGGPLLRSRGIIIVPHITGRGTTETSDFLITVLSNLRVIFIKFKIGYKWWNFSNILLLSYVATNPNKGIVYVTSLQ